MTANTLFKILDLGPFSLFLIVVHGLAFISITYSLSGFGQDLQMPSSAIKLLGQRKQNLLFSLGTKPSGQLLHEPS